MVAVEGYKASIEVISLLGTEVVLCNIGYLAEFVISYSIQDLHVLKDHKIVWGLETTHLDVFVCWTDLCT